MAAKQNAQQRRKIIMKTEEPIKCPFCGNKTILATVLTTMSFLSEHPLYNTGVDMQESDKSTMGTILGEPNGTTMRYNGFRCTSCNKKWKAFQCRLIKDENDIITAIEVQDNKKEKK